MSKKSIFLSLLAFILFCGVLVGIVFLFKVHFLMVLIGVVAFILPVYIQKKAIDASKGRVDKIIAKYIVPALAVVATLFTILSIAFWIKA